MTVVCISISLLLWIELEKCHLPVKLLHPGDCGRCNSVYILPMCDQSNRSAAGEPPPASSFHTGRHAADTPPICSSAWWVLLSDLKVFVNPKGWLYPAFVISVSGQSLPSARVSLWSMGSKQKTVLKIHGALTFPCQRLMYASVSGIVLLHICSSVAPLSDCLAWVDCLSDLFKSQEAFYGDTCGGKANSSSPYSVASGWGCSLQMALSWQRLHFLW